MECYQIILKGHIEKRRFRGLGEIELDLTLSGDTQITCRHFDQSALHSLITRISDLGLQLIEIRRVNIK